MLSKLTNRTVLFLMLAGVALLSAYNAQAATPGPFQPDTEIALTVGTLSTNVDVDAGQTPTGSSGLQMGGLAFIPFSDQVYFRTGFLYSQKYFAVKSAGVTTDYKFTYLDIPLTLFYKFSDFGGAFIGPVLSMNQAKDCSNSTGSGNCTGVASSLTPIALGANFKFAPQMGGQLMYEFTSSKVADGVTGMKTLAANLVIYFE